MSAPHPEGLGAELALKAALEDAGVSEKAVDYLNMHATATPQNDAIESLVIHRLFPQGIPVSGTKPMTGHTLGAAGAMELGLCWLALKEGLLPPHLWDREADPALPRLSFVEKGTPFPRRTNRLCMSSSFAFGGNNACLLIGDAR
jgi:3-oxoacyl-[acyl-carrier-protein] synthase-1